MANVLSQALVYLALMAAGYVGKRAGLFCEDHADFLRSVILYITMPCVAVNGLQGIRLESSFAWCFGVGLTACTCLMLIGLAVYRKAPMAERLAYLFSMSNYNVGNFAIPFLTGLVTANGFTALCLFDIAMAMSLYGVCYSVAEVMRGTGGFSGKLLAQKMFTSPITVTYLVMIALAGLGVQLPAPVLNLAQVCAGANGFLAMLSVGILFEPRFGKRDAGAFAGFFSLRYGVSALLACAVWTLLPLAVDVRQALCVLLMAPVGSVGPLLTRNTGGNAVRAAQLNSMSIPLGIVLMVAMFALTDALLAAGV